jgi:hypothetical protein
MGRPKTFRVRPASRTGARAVPPVARASAAVRPLARRGRMLATPAEFGRLQPGRTLHRCLARPVARSPGRLPNARQGHRSPSDRSGVPPVAPSVRPIARGLQSARVSGRTQRPVAPTRDRSQAHRSQRATGATLGTGRTRVRPVIPNAPHSLLAGGRFRGDLHRRGRRGADRGLLEAQGAGGRAGPGVVAMLPGGVRPLAWRPVASLGDPLAADRSDAYR